MNRKPYLTLVEINPELVDEQGRIKKVRETVRELKEDVAFLKTVVAAKTIELERMRFKNLSLRVHIQAISN